MEFLEQFNMPPKRKCKFNDELQKEFKFLKKTNLPNEVRCEKCLAVFSIANGGKYDISQHLQTNKHKRCDVAAASSKTMDTFFCSTVFEGATKINAVNEGTWAYHTVQHNHSFRSTDCTSKLIKNCFCEKYSSARTKTESIVCNILAPNSIQQVKKDLEAANFLTIYVDCSNHLSTKICPILVRYFNPKNGIQVKILEFKDLPGESSDIISKYLQDTLLDFEITEKILAICADNTNCNFGGSARRGTNNVFKKMQEFTGNVLIGVNCAAHILNNCIQTAVECLPIDMEVIVVKIYSFFYIYTIRVEKLKEICDNCDVEYQKLLGHSKTRWLSLKPAIERILRLFKPLKEYFQQQQKVPTVLKNFFDNSLSEAWLHFIYTQAVMFHSKISEIESQEVCMAEGSLIIKDMKSKLKLRIEELFIPRAVQHNLFQLEKDNILVDQNNFKQHILEFYKTCLEYLNQWDSAFIEIEIFSWALLHEIPTWKNLSESLNFIFSKRNNIKINDSELFDEYNCLKEYLDKEIILWSRTSITLNEKWIAIFQHFSKNNISFKNLLIILEFCMCLPVSNAPTERIFSIMNNVWTNEKAQLKTETLKSILITRCNYKLNCLEFKAFLESNNEIAKKISGSAKYA